jgi:putative tryptophan/tyrosine transport system substrate-binding protein
MGRRWDRRNRREIVVGAGGLALLGGCGRLPGQAVPPRIPRIGFLALRTTAESQLGGAFREDFLQGLREYGYVEGQSIVIEWRSPDGPDELPSLAAELVRLPVDLIVAPGGATAVAAKQATSTIPIVFVTVADPVGSGLVASLARPGGNVTGMSSLFGPLVQKRLELLKEAAPHTSRVACLYESSDPGSPATLQLLMEAARPLGVTVEALGVQAPEDFDHVFEAATRLPADAVLAMQGPLFRSQMRRIVDFAAKHRLPAVYAWREAVDAGGLMSYGSNTAAQFQRAAYYVDRLLKGAKPADLPVEQPMRFEFVVNMKTAQELGIVLPNEIMLQVTEVIQ